MNVFLCEHLHRDAVALLRSRAEIVADWGRLAECDGLISRNLKLPRETLARAPQLKVIAVHGTGSDGIDLEWCAARNITVTYVPAQNADSVAELIAALALDLMRRVTAADRAVRSGRPVRNSPPEFCGRELAGKTLGLIGVGDIARRAARILREGFGMKVIGYSPSLTPEKAKMFHVEHRPSVIDVMQGADVISLGVHLTGETFHLIGAKELAAARKGAVLINTSRGGVVDEEALYEALRVGRLAGAACDVWEHEPPTAGHRLLSLDNVIATPHLGANTDEALRRVGTAAVQALFDVCEGRKPRCVYSVEHPLGFENRDVPRDGS